MQPLDVLACNSANNPSFQNPEKCPFCPTLPRWKKCSDILKVASIGRGESANLKASHFSQAFRFAIFPPPTDATFKMSLHFFHL